MAIRGSSISIVRDDKPLVSPTHIPMTKSWAELEAFFKRERQAEGRQYKKEVPKQMQEYRGWVFSAIDCIVDRMGSVKYKFYRKDSGQELTTSSPYYKAITKPIMYPNDYMSFEFILQWCQVQLDLSGKACIYRKKNAFGKTWELWPLDMNDFEGISYDGKGVNEDKINPLNPPKGFVFKIGDQSLLFPPESVIWLRYPHPESLWNGFSPIQAQAYITDIDYYLEVYERGFFQNSARIDFILEHEGNINEEDAQRIKDMWTTAFSGSKRSYQPVVTGGGVRVVPITYSNRDFQFMEMANWTKDRILGAYRVPEGKLGLFGDINRANQKGIDISFNEECYSEDTEFLTENGWRDIYSYVDERIATVNPVTREIEYHLPTKKIEYDYSGKMIQFSTKQIDMLVTPGHRMWYSLQTGTTENGKWETAYTPWGFDEAKDLQYNGNGIGRKRTYLTNPPVKFGAGEWISRFIIDEVPRETNALPDYKTKDKRYKIDADLWLEFLGYYLSEGWLCSKSWKTYISQHSKDSYRIRKCLDKLPFDFRETLSTNYYGESTIIKFETDDKTLWEYLMDECGTGSDGKCIPEFVFDLCHKQKSILFDAFLFGDGTKNRFENKRGNSSEYSSVTTTCYKMSEQLGILAISLGYKVGYGPPWKTKIGSLAYRVNLTKMPYSSIRAHQIGEVGYEGKVWCFNVPNHLFITRRNGKVAVQGNCIRPRLDLWDKEITKQLIWPEFSDKIEMKFDNPVPRDREMDLKELELREGKYSVNELRNWWEGAPPVDGGEVILIDNKLIPLTSAGKILPGDGGSDRPGDSEETPDSDTENDPGGDESEKLIEHIPQIPLTTIDPGLSKSLEPLLEEYDRVLEYTNGWSYKKAEEYARNNSQIYMGDSIKDLFAESVKYAVDKDVFRKRVITFLVEQVAKRLDKPPDDSKYDEIAEKMKEMESKLTESRKDPSIHITMPEINIPERISPSIHIDNKPAKARAKNYKVVRDEDGFILNLEIEEEEISNVDSD